jgi:hypothetical protein
MLYSSDQIIFSYEICELFIISTSNGLYIMKIEENVTIIVQLLKEGIWIVGASFNPVYTEIFMFANYIIPN